MLTAKEAAAAMDGNEYGDEGSPELFERMKEARLVCLFGYSDDVVEIRGAAHDEMDAGNTLYFTPVGLLTNQCDHYDCPYFALAARNAKSVDTKDGGDEYGLWDWETEIPFERFIIKEDGDVYGSGIVFSLDELEATSRQPEGER